MNQSNLDINNINIKSTKLTFSIKSYIKSEVIFNTNKIKYV